MKHDTTYYLYNLVVPLGVVTGVLMVIYTILALMAARRRQKPALLFWFGALIATGIGAHAMDTTEKAMDKAMQNIDTPWPQQSLWFLALAGVMVLVPLVNWGRAIFAGEFYQMALWGTMFGAASIVFAQSGLYHYFQDGWGLGASLLQILFVLAGLTLLGFTVQEAIQWRRDRRWMRETLHSVS